MAGTATAHAWSPYTASPSSLPPTSPSSPRLPLDWWNSRMISWRRMEATQWPTGSTLSCMRCHYLAWSKSVSTRLRCKDAVQSLCTDSRPEGPGKVCCLCGMMNSSRLCRGSQMSSSRARRATGLIASQLFLLEVKVGTRPTRETPRSGRNGCSLQWRVAWPLACIHLTPPPPASQRMEAFTPSHCRSWNAGPRVGEGSTVQGVCDGYRGPNPVVRRR